MKKLVFLACIVLSSSAVAKFNFGILTGVNIINGHTASVRMYNESRYYQTTYNTRLLSTGICAGYDYFFSSLILGIDASWLYNQDKWNEIGKIANGDSGILIDPYEKIQIKSPSQYGIGIRVGYLCGRLMPYLRLGAEKIRLNIRLVSNSIIDNKFNTYQKSNSQLAVSTSLGCEYKAYDNFWLRFEGRYINTKSYNMHYFSNSYRDDARIKISSQRILLTAGIIYRF